MRNCIKCPGYLDGDCLISVPTLFCEALTDNGCKLSRREVEKKLKEATHERPN